MNILAFRGGSLAVRKLKIFFFFVICGVELDCILERSLFLL